MSLGSWNLVLFAVPGPFAQFFQKCRQVDVREGAGLKTGLKDDRAVRIGPVVMYAEDWPRLRRGLRVANLSDCQVPAATGAGLKMSRIKRLWKTNNLTRVFVESRPDDERPPAGTTRLDATGG